MGSYTTYAWVKTRIKFDRLKEFLEDQITDADDSTSAIDTELDDYVEDNVITQVESQINVACRKQVDVPVVSTNLCFGMLVNIARAMTLREVFAHSKHNEVPPKIENAFIAAIRQLGQIARGELDLTSDTETGPLTDGDSMRIDVTTDDDTFETQLTDEW